MKGPTQLPVVCAAEVPFPSKVAGGGLCGPGLAQTVGSSRESLDINIESFMTTARCEDEENCLHFQ